MSYWKEVAQIMATFHEPGLEPDDALGIEVWAPTDNPNAQWAEYKMSPIWIGSAPLYHPESLLEHLCPRDLLRTELEAIQEIMTAERKDGGATVSILTVWDCYAGYQYIPGEPDEYDSGAQLVGYFKPKTLEYVAL